MLPQPTLDTVVHQRISRRKVWDVGLNFKSLVRLRGPLGRNSVNLKVYRFAWLKAEAFLFAALADLGLKVKGLWPGFGDF